MNAFRSASVALAILSSGCGTHHGTVGTETTSATGTAATVGASGSSSGGGGAGGSSGTFSSGIGGASTTTTSATTGNGGATSSAATTTAATTTAATTTAATTAASSSGTVMPHCPCWSGDGLYCETSAASYGSSHGCTIGTGSSDDLLSCSGGSWSVHQTCSNGCTVEPAGMADQCTQACGGLGLSAFINKFTGMCTGYPGWSPPNQCTDLALQWVANLCLPVQFSGNAVNWATEHVQGFTWVQNAPGIVPSPGDIVVYGPVGMTCNDGVGAVGHVDICVSASANSYDWKAFDQNWETDWNGTCYPPQVVNHNWGECVIGWHHANVPVPP